MDITSASGMSSPLQTPPRVYFPLNDDIQLYSLLPLLSMRDICVYSCASKACNLLSAQFCKGKIERDILPMQRKSKKWMERQVPVYFTYQQMYRAFLPFAFAIDSYYQATDPSSKGAKGTLAKLTFARSEELCGYIFTCFSGKDDRYLFEDFQIIFHRKSCGFRLVVEYSAAKIGLEFPFGINDRGIILSPDSKYSRHFEALEDLSSLNSLAPAEKYIQRLCGLFKVGYGGHGDQIVYVTPKRDPITGEIIGLFGRKVTGDEFMPAAKNAFHVDLRTRETEPILRDPRPILSLQSDPFKETSFDFLRDHVALTCRGNGYFSIDPPIWTSLLFLVYKSDNLLGFDDEGLPVPSAFSLLFDIAPEAANIFCFDFDSSYSL